MAQAIGSSRISVIARLFVLLFTLISLQGQAQRTKDLERKLEAIRKDLTLYATLEPHIADQDVIGIVQERIVAATLDALNDPRIVKLDIAPYFEKMSLVASLDKRLWFLSLDERTGGSARTHIAVMHTRNNDGKVSANRVHEVDGSHGLGESTFERIHQLEPNSYFTIAYLRSCLTCVSTHALHVVLDGTTADIRVIHNYQGRMEPELESFEFDGLDHTFRYAYRFHEDDPLYGLGRSTEWHSGAYRYSNGTFVETEHCVYR
jgi:hypothetical protein